MRKRLVITGMCGLGAAAVVAVGLGVRESRGGVLADHAGTVLYAILVYLLACMAVLACLIVSAYLKVTTTIAVGLRPLPLGALTVAVCWQVEFVQLTGVPAQLATHSKWSRLALGAAFQPLDLVWYAVAAVIAAGLHWTGPRLRARHVRRVTTRHAGQDAAGPQGVASPLGVALGVQGVTVPPDSGSAR